MNPDHATILANCAKNLEKGRAVAMGIGVFVLVEEDGKFLFRLRGEKESMFGTDLSGRYELLGGGVELVDFVVPPQKTGSVYQWPVISALGRELFEEAGLDLYWYGNPVPMMPAWLMKNGQIDLAFVVALSMSRPNLLSDNLQLNVCPTARFHELMKSGEIRFFSLEEIEKLDIISLRMRYMVKSAISAINGQSVF